GHPMQSASPATLSAEWPGTGPPSTPAGRQRYAPSPHRSGERQRGCVGWSWTGMLFRVTDEGPTWDMLLELTNHGGLTDDGKEAARWAVEWLSDLLGPSWLRRQYQRMGRLPGELIMFASHQYVLPSLLSFVTRLRAVATVEPTFAPVLT